MNTSDITKEHIKAALENIKTLQKTAIEASEKGDLDKLSKTLGLQNIELNNLLDLHNKTEGQK